MNKTHFLGFIILIIAVKNDAHKEREDVKTSKNYVIAGLSNDPEICEKYNDNLLKVWDVFQQNNIVEGPAPRLDFIHDIALLVKAFIDHRQVPTHQGNENKVEKPRIHLKKILNKIKDVIHKNDKYVWTNKIVEVVMYDFRHVAENLQNVECHKRNDQELKKFTGRAVEKYLTGNCRRSKNFHTLSQIELSDNIFRLRLRNVCDEEDLDEFMKIMKSVIQRYIIGSFCYGDKTKRTEFVFPFNW